MNMHYTGRIRRIVIGQNIKEGGMSFHVGQGLSVLGTQITIKEIVHDIDSYSLSGVSKYIIYCQKSGSNDLIPFKSTENMPVFLEYDILNEI